MADVSGRYAGIFQWTINIQVKTAAPGPATSPIDLTFGPSAWFANEHPSEWFENERGSGWPRTVSPAIADYSKILVSCSQLQEIQESSVTMEEALHGLEPGDMRLHDQIVALLRRIHEA